MKRTTDLLRQALAAEYALGLMTQPVRRRFERLRQEDARFCLPLDDWENRFANLIRALPDDRPPDRLWSRIAARLDRR